MVDELAILLAPAQRDRAVGSGHAPFTPIEARVGEPDSDSLVHGVYTLQAEDVTKQHMHTAVGREAMVTACGRPVMFPKRAGAVRHIKLVSERFVQDLLAHPVAREQFEP